MICKSLNSLTSRIQALPDEILVKQNKKNILTAVQLALHYYFVFGLSRTWEKRPREAPSSTVSFDFVTKDDWLNSRVDPLIVGGRGRTVESAEILVVTLSS